MFHTFQTRHDAVGFFSHLLVYVFALLIILIDVSGHAQGRGIISFYQQVYAQFAVFHSAGSIDAGTDLEHNVAHREFASVQTADVDDGFQTDTWIGIQQFKTMEGEYSVLIYHRHNVGCNTDGTEVEQGDEPGERNVVVLGESLHKLESYTASAEMLERERIVWALRIEYGHSGWHHVVRDMMVADDEVYSQTLGIFYLLDSLDSTV